MFRAASMLLVALAFAVPAHAASEPDALVTEFHAALTQTMARGEALGCKGRIDRLEPVITSTFDIAYVAGHILRRRWDGLSAEQRSAFTTTLKDLIVVTYASNFSRDSGVRFATQETREVSATRRQVRTQLMPAGGDAVTLDYFLQKSADGWRVINVIANGVSDLALRSSQYEKVFAQSGFDGLMGKLTQQIAADRAAC